MRKLSSDCDICHHKNAMACVCEKRGLCQTMVSTQSFLVLGSAMLQNLFVCPAMHAMYHSTLMPFTGLLHTKDGDVENRFTV